MAATVGAIRALLQADASGLNRGLNLAAGRIGRFEATATAQLGRLDRTFLGLGRGIPAAIGAGLVASIAPILSFGAALRTAKSAMEDFDRIAKSAKAAGLGAEQFQQLSYAAQLGGVSVDQFAKGLEAFARNAGLAAVGKGRMVSQLKALNPALAESLRLATSQNERLRLVADALDKESDASRRAAIATAAFGEVGARMVEALKGGSAALDATAVKARALGLVINGDLIARAEDLGDEFGTVSKILDLQFKSAMIDLAPLLINGTRLMGEFARSVAVVGDQFRDVESRTFVRPLQNALAELHNVRIPLGEEIAKIREAMNSLPDNNPSKGFLRLELDLKVGEFERLTAEAERLLDRIAALQGRGSQPITLPPVDTEGVELAAQRLEDFQAGLARLRQQIEAATFERLTSKLSAADAELAKIAHQSGVAAPLVRQFVASLNSANPLGIASVVGQLQQVIEKLLAIKRARNVTADPFAANRRRVGDSNQYSRTQSSFFSGGGSGGGGLSQTDVATGVKSGVGELTTYVQTSSGLLQRVTVDGFGNVVGKVGGLHAPLGGINTSVVQSGGAIVAAINNLGSSLSVSGGGSRSRGSSSSSVFRDADGNPSVTDIAGDSLVGRKFNIGKSKTTLYGGVFGGKFGDPNTPVGQLAGSGQSAIGEPTVSTSTSQDIVGDSGIVAAAQSGPEAQTVTVSTGDINFTVQGTDPEETAREIEARMADLLNKLQSGRVI